MNYVKIILTNFFIFIYALNVSGQGYDLVEGNLIQFNDNGFWCWYQDERAVVDTVEGKLIIGSVAGGSGTGGSNRNGNIEAVIYDLNLTTSQRTSFWKPGCDDHNAPGFIIRPDGKYLAMYAEHYDQWNTRYKIYDGNEWGNEQRFDWTTINTDYTIAYNNVYYLSSENRMYDFTRANHRAPNFLISDDMGSTWSFGGQLTTNQSNTYNKGYYKYWGNGVDRIDFIFTEQHPRDTSTSIYHGYIKNGKTYDSYGTVIDEDIYTNDYIPTFHNFTKVFADSTIINSNAMRRCWNTDVMRYNDGVIATIITARINDNQGGGSTSINPDHAFIYCRFNGINWTYTYLGQAGKKMYGSEQDYTGLAAVNPNNPNVIYISTHVDPRNDAQLSKREIFKGVTDDDAATWSWTPVTSNSTVDNFRPIIPLWNSDATALLWCRGSYTAAQNFNSVVVGLIEYEGAANGEMTYMDATTTNTTNTNGTALNTTGPNANDGPNDNLWHQRSDDGNGSTLLTSSETVASGSENAPVILTKVTVPGTGIYDVWVNFWGNPSADWRIKAGLSEASMQIFRQKASKQVEAGDHDAVLVLTGSNNSYLYQAYLGKVQVTSGDSFYVYVDDESIQTGSTSTRPGNTTRTWYDGISYRFSKSLDVSPSSIELTSVASDSSFDITSNVDWNVSSSEDWLTVNPLTGSNDETVSIYATENTLGLSRSAVITVTATGVSSKLINITQSGLDPEASVSVSSLEIEPGANSTNTFTVTSNTIWNVSSNQTWLTCNPLSDTLNGSVTLTAAANSGLSSREAIVTISGIGFDPQTITVTQLAAPQLNVDPLSLNVESGENSTESFDITSNVTWNVSSSQTWLTVSSTFGSNSETITVTAEENPDNATRNAIVTITGTDVTDQTVYVTQAAHPVSSLTSDKISNCIVYPNPVIDKLNIRLNSNSSLIRIYSIDGKQLLSITTQDTETEINLSDFKSGMYILKIVSDTTVTEFKITKK